MIDRKPGYYWIKFAPNCIWEVAKWCDIDNEWSITGIKEYYQDEVFDKIYENRITLPFGINHGTTT